ncbi:hypothetical protein CY34DRAFT_803563 [Suillus luteus UH-Slu-Lm8-n1]|uniref:WD40 repeat-like protein n=1 Tax=Suillus luteus UH-Slu-Lm8-n1 TaxID=930992 RepID=A0A0D0BBR1_9AGAM|nr:hypothetical protein CY34DRAFT_803563 [Suillus luteus UH-Slu-Lm8-n1]
MDAPTKHKSLATMPHRKIKVNNQIGHVLHLPDGKRVIIYSWDGSFRNWDLETGTQVGEEWEDKGFGLIMALSPDGKKVASGSPDGAVKLWNIDTGKIIKTLTGHTTEVRCLCWSSDGGQVVSGCKNGTFRAWDVEDEKTILGPIKAVEPHMQWAVCYSPDAKMIATGGNGLKIWDVNKGQSLKSFEGVFMCLAWTSDGKTLFAGGSSISHITKIDTATWTALDLCENIANTISLSPNERILASTSYDDKTAQLWNLDTNQPIGTPLHHQGLVSSATFSVDGKFLVTCCRDDHIYTWDVSAIIKKAGLPSDIVDVTPRAALKVTGARRVPPGFFDDDALREANSRIRLSQSHAPPTPTPHQRTFSPLSSFWHRSKPHGATEPTTLSESRSRPFSWTRNLSGILRRRVRSHIQLREVAVPYTAGKPKTYHATGRSAATSSRPPNIYNTRQPSITTQNTLPLSQQPPAAATASPLSAGTPGTMGSPSRSHSTVAIWRARFVRFLCCAPTYHIDGEH